MSQWESDKYNEQVKSLNASYVHRLPTNTISSLVFTTYCNCHPLTHTVFLPAGCHELRVSVHGGCVWLRSSSNNDQRVGAHRKAFRRESKIKGRLSWSSGKLWTMYFAKHWRFHLKVPSSRHVYTLGFAGVESLFSDWLNPKKMGAKEVSVVCHAPIHFQYIRGVIALK